MRIIVNNADGTKQEVVATISALQGLPVTKLQYHFFGTEFDALGNAETRLFKGNILGLMSLPFPNVFTGTLHVDQLDIDTPATEDKQAVRFKEFSVTKDTAIINRVAISVMQGQTFTITGNSYIKALARLAEHLQVPLPTGYTD